MTTGDIEYTPATVNVSSFSNDLATEGFFPEVQKHLRIIQLMMSLACFHPKMSVMHAEILLWKAGSGHLPVVHLTV